MAQWLYTVLATICTVAVSICWSAQADTIHLKNGQTLEGSIIRQSDEELVLKLSVGEVTLKKSDVSKIEKDGEATAPGEMPRAPGAEGPTELPATERPSQSRPRSGAEQKMSPAEKGFYETADKALKEKQAERTQQARFIQERLSQLQQEYDRESEVGKKKDLQRRMDAMRQQLDALNQATSAAAKAQVKDGTATDQFYSAQKAELEAQKKEQERKRAEIDAKITDLKAQLDKETRVAKKKDLERWIEKLEAEKITLQPQPTGHYGR